MKIKRNFHLYILMNAFLIYERLQGQSITCTVSVPVQFNILPSAIPGDPVVSTYENTLGDVTLDMLGKNPGNPGKKWYVTVQKSTLGWHANLTLEVHRDSLRSDVIDGDNYIIIPDAPTANYFFKANNIRSVPNLAIQHRITMTTPVLVGTYTTTITYTIINGDPP